MYETTNDVKERAVLFGMTGSRPFEQEAADRSLDELAALAETSGAEVVGRALQSRIKPDARTFLGNGKMLEIAEAARSMEAGLLICDEELTPSQIRNIEELTEIRTIDRTSLILDIFALRAQTREGRWQVELAQYEYRLPRLRSVTGKLSRLGGGIGTRGPGETKLESDRRHIHRRISTLKANIERAARHRERLRDARSGGGALSVAVVGYTNAGKSTLINRLCRSDLFAADQVFATLDPSVRKLHLDGDRRRGRDTVLVDTIGFINKLPHQLIDAFKSTLEETVHADLILLVVDGADPNAEQKLRVTEELIKELSAGDVPRVLVINKIDAVDREMIEPGLYQHARSSRGLAPVEVSARTGDGLEALKTVLDGLLDELVD